MMEGSFSMESVRAHEQVIAEQRNTLIINMTRKRMPKAMHKYNTQGGLTPQSVHTDSTSSAEAPGSTTKTEYEAINAPSSAGWSKASA